MNDIWRHAIGTARLMLFLLAGMAVDSYLDAEPVLRFALGCAGLALALGEIREIRSGR